MAYQGTYSLPTIGGRLRGSATFNNQKVGTAFAEAVQQAGPGFQGLKAGQYFTGKGGTQYKTVAGIDPNQPGWGQFIEPGYELIGYQEGRSGERPGGRRAYSKMLDLPSFAILQKKPATAPAAAPAESTPDPAQALKIAELTEQSQAYRTQAEQQLAAANAKVAELSDAQLQAQKAKELQERFAITAAANQARSAQMANLQIAPASATPMTAGTQSFKRRPRQLMRPIGQTTSKLTVPTSNVLNI